MRQPPYLDWSLDRWKIGLVLVLFAGLVVAAVTDDSGRDPALLGAPVIALGTQATSDLAGGLVGQATSVASTDSSGTAADALSFPLTLANLGPNAIVPAGSLRVLFGTAAAGSIVEVHDQVLPYGGGQSLSPGSAVDLLLGVTDADRDGLWQLEPATPPAPGQHVITLRQLSDRGQITAVSAPVVVTVLAGGEQGPLSLATPSIRYPYVGARLAPGQVTFLGSGLPGVIIRLYLGNRLAAEGTATTREDWRLTTEEELTPGVYVARVLALNPQGDVIAESAPVVFVISEETGTGQSWRMPEPAVPLSIAALAYGDASRTALVVGGIATPHAGVSLWMDGRPLKVTNAQVDGRWQMWFSADGATLAQLEVRSNLGERVRTGLVPQLPVVSAAAVTPMLITPRPGQVLTTRRPVVTGLAQPAGEVVVMVNGRVVAEVRSDALGQWAYQLVEPLPAGSTSLGAGTRDAMRRVQMAHPVLVTVAPRL